MPSSPPEVADHILAILRDATYADYIGEPVSQLAHALQAAAAARRANAPDNEVLAALLHDIGHLVAPPNHPRSAGVGVIDHERVGQAYLRDLGVDETVVALIAAHVDAKRYLVARNPAYAAALSPASKRSLDLQGGLMSPEECAAFGRSPLRDAALRLRSWDDAAKVEGAVPDELESYRAMLVRHLVRPH